MTVLNRAGLLASSMLIGAGVSIAASVAAVAQEEEGSQEVIIVTGSRIPQANLITSSPVTEVTSADITGFGVSRVEDLINQLPQAFAAQNATVSNGATGTATIDLRGLGPERTLVLVDGRRMPYGSPVQGGVAADVNSIPAPLVERVEILTGGASAVYGSDAVAGVVNFIMKEDFEGIQADVQYSFFQHNNDYDTNGNLRDVIIQRGQTNPAQFKLPEDTVIDGEGKQIALIMGANSPDDRGNVTAYATYRDNSHILQSERDYSACAIGAATATAFTCGGSGTAFPGTFTDFSTFSFTIDQATGEFRPFVTALDQYNFGPLNFYQRPDERYSLGAFGHYEINDRAEAYAQLMFTDYDSNSQIAPSGNFFSTSAINCDNPFFSAGQRAALCLGDRVPDIEDDPTTPENERQDAIDEFMDPAGAGLSLADATFLVDRTLGIQSCTSDDAANTLDDLGSAEHLDVFDTYGNPDNCPLSIGRRNVEGGGRQDHLAYEAYRAVVGMRGDLDDAWSYDVFGQFSRVRLSRAYQNDFSVSRLGEAIFVVDGDGDPATFDPACRSGAAGCVPYNPWQIGGITPEALDYLHIPLLQIGSTQQQVVSGTLTGDLGSYGIATPSAPDGLQVAVGVEYRRDELESITDTAFATGDGAGQGGPTIGLSGAVENVDVFGEAQFPLIEDAPFADLLSVDAAFRYSDYGDFTTDTYKTGIEYAPTGDVRFRGSFQRAVRAPNVFELFFGQGFNLFDADFDPCDAVNRPASAGPVPASCIGTNPWQVSSAESNAGGLASPAGQYNFLQGGNPDLAPEEVDTYTIGAVFTPSFLEGLTVSLDYFNIELTDRVDNVDPLVTLEACYEQNDPGSCGRIFRNANGQLWVGEGHVVALNTNIGGLSTSGFDLVGDYAFDLGDLGGGAINIVGTYLDTLETDPGLGDWAVFDCKGSYANECGIPNPEWRHRAQATWSTPWMADVTLGWRYYGEVSLFGNTADRVDATLEAQSYFDLSGTWQVAETTILRAGVNNILDDDPPLSASVGTTGNGNTYPQTYDAAGRFFFFGLTQDF